MQGKREFEMVAAAPTILLLTITLLNASSQSPQEGLLTQHSGISNPRDTVANQTSITATANATHTVYADNKTTDTSVNETIVDGSIQVSPGDQSKPFNISVHNNGANARLIGRYFVQGGIIPAIHLYLVDVGKCVNPLKPSSCSSYIINEINAYNNIDINLPTKKSYNLLFLNDATLAEEIKNINAKFVLEYNPIIVNVRAGGGNSTVSLNQFFPSKTEVKVGESVTWYNSAHVPEPHTVTFVLDNKSMAGVFAPFTVSTPTKFMPLPPGSNSQPALLPGRNGMDTVIALNERVFNPVVIDSSGNAKFMRPNSNYTIDGSEKYINSGFLLPKGQEQEFPGSAVSFTVTFKKAGTYDYFDIFHPWMRGKVVVQLPS